MSPRNTGQQGRIVDELNTFVLFLNTGCCNFLRTLIMGK